MTEASVPRILQQDGVVVVEFPRTLAQIDEGVIAAVSHSLMDAAEQARSGRMIVDLSHVQFFGSSFIEALFRSWNRIQKQAGAKLILCGVQEYCLEVLQITHLDRLWPIVATRAEAQTLAAA